MQEYDNIVISWLKHKDGVDYFVTPEVGIDVDNDTIDTRMCGCDVFDNIDDALSNVKEFIEIKLKEK